MKMFALSFLLACSIKIAKADSGAAGFVQILTTEERTQVLQLMNDGCEQRWCVGQFDFKFKSFFCEENTATCRLRFKVMDRGFIPGSFSQKYMSCTFLDIKSAEQIFEDGKLNERFMKELDFCIIQSTEN